MIDGPKTISPEFLLDLLISSKEHRDIALYLRGDAFHRIPRFVGSIGDRAMNNASVILEVLEMNGVLGVDGASKMDELKQELIRTQAQLDLKAKALKEVRNRGLIARIINK